MSQQEPEGMFRSALQRLIGADTEQETDKAVQDLEEALTQILEKRDREWKRLLEEKEKESPEYGPDLQGFSRDLADAVADSVDRRIEEKLAGRTPEPPAEGRPAPSVPDSEVEQLKERVDHIQEILKGDMKPEVKAELKQEARDRVSSEIERNDELGKMLGELADEIQEELKEEMRGELRTEMKQAIKEEVRRELKKELM